MFGTSNRNQNGEYNNIGKSGEVIRMGDGQQVLIRALIQAILAV